MNLNFLRDKRPKKHRRGTRPLRPVMSKPRTNAAILILLGAILMFAGIEYFSLESYFWYQDGRKPVLQTGGQAATQTPIELPPIETRVTAVTLTATLPVPITLPTNTKKPPPPKPTDTAPASSTPTTTPTSDGAPLPTISPSPTESGSTSPTPSLTQSGKPSATVGVSPTSTSTPAPTN